MTVFIPKKMRVVKKSTSTFCRWCGKHNTCKTMYKLRDGPIDWWFCNDDHALEWIDNRHMLRKEPAKRDLGGLSIDEWVSVQLSQDAVKRNA